jgi:arginyl-tRNA synthetase
LRRAVEVAAAGINGGAVGDRLTLERPPRAELGDYSTNAAMLLAPVAGAPPREIAERLREDLGRQLGSSAERIEVAGPGFLNVFLSDAWHREAVIGVLGAGERFGAGGPSGERVLVEFVSANPTGPVTAAAGRGAAYGDSVARLLEFTGNEVEREYYMNDAGAQVRLFAESIAARMRGTEPPEGGYVGDYVGELADELVAEGVGPDDLDLLERRGIETMRGRIEASLSRYGVRFDTWFSERSLHESGAMEKAIAELRERGHIYDSEGAVWLRTTEFGDDKDRVLIRATGEPTYFATDISYHRDKLGRGFAHLVTPLGADHHGYVPRMKASLTAFGADPEIYEAPIMQMVSILEGGQRARMSKRKGEFVTLDELVDDIGVDAARYFMVQRSHDTTLDLDLELARSQSQDNPVYYVQYAHARIASILRKAVAEAGAPADEDGVAEAAKCADELAAGCEPSERALVRRLLELPSEAATAAGRRAPHRVCAYASAAAADFHAFYRDCRVVGAEPATQAARLALCVAAKRTLATTLSLIGVSAPERM